MRKQKCPNFPTVPSYGTQHLQPPTIPVFLSITDDQHLCSGPQSPLSLPQQFISISSRISYLYKSKQSITISGYHLFSQLPSKIPQELYKLVSPLSHLSFSPQPTPAGLLCTSCGSNSAFDKSVNELEVVNSMVNSYLVWPLSSIGHGWFVPLS